VELAEVLSNPEASARLGRALKAVAGLKPDPRAMTAPPRPVRPPQGQLLRAIKTVLADQPAGLRTVEVWQRVEARLGRPVFVLGRSRTIWQATSAVADASSGRSEESTAFGPPIEPYRREVTICFSCETTSVCPRRCASFSMSRLYCVRVVPCLHTVPAWGPALRSAIARSRTLRRDK
jgi:hypothetical protein